jgi:hypothetical protein
VIECDSKVHDLVEYRGFDTRPSFEVYGIVLPKGVFSSVLVTAHCTKAVSDEMLLGNLTNSPRERSRSST